MLWFAFHEPSLGILLPTSFLCMFLTFLDQTSAFVDLLSLYKVSFDCLLHHLEEREVKVCFILSS